MHVLDPSGVVADPPRGAATRGALTGEQIAGRVIHSARSDGRFMSTSECLEWMQQRRAARGFEVRQIPFDELIGWSFTNPGGNLVHRSGRFFSVEGLRVASHPGMVRNWSQPIIVQFEIGILGILVKEFDGVLHCLMQAKMEPGNSNAVQLSPTVQATRSNYMRIHEGKSTPYLEYFLAPSRGRVLADTLQTEQGAWFLHKRNRNMVIETDDEVTVLEDYCWLTIAQIQQLLCIDNVVNMDARTVLSGMPFESSAIDPARIDAMRIDRMPIDIDIGAVARPDEDGYGESLRRSLRAQPDARHTIIEVISWLTENKAGSELVQERIPLDEVTGWHRTPTAIEHASGDFFRVVAVDVRATSREVAQWTQPLLAPVAPGILALLTRRIDGVLHLLMHAKSAAGALDMIEIAPTLHCMPYTYRDVDPAGWPRFLDYVLSADPLQVRFQAWLSEEGGRFLNAKNRYVIVEVDDDFPTAEPDGYIWLTVHQLMMLVRGGNCVNVEARSLLACLETWIVR